MTGKNKEVKVGNKCFYFGAIFQIKLDLVIEGFRRIKGESFKDNAKYSGRNDGELIKCNTLLFYKKSFYKNYPEAHSRIHLFF